MSSSSSASTTDSSDPIYDITREDIANIYAADGRYNPEGGAVIHAKLANGFPAGQRSYMQMSEDYDRVFFTSDIHSDLRKFIQMLIKNQLITTPILPYTGDAIYSPELIADSEWIGGTHTCLVIVGDIVDGRRIFNAAGTLSNSVDDKKGSFEFLLLALLYNLRRKANRVASEILFTIGNHEFGSILKETILYTYYVTDKSKLFFNDSWAVRSAALLPFLNTSPYYMISFISPNHKVEVQCAHGGFHSDPEGTNLFVSLHQVQDTIDGGMDLADITDDVQDAINTRVYTNESTGFCEKLKTSPATSMHSEFLLTIVGHCITGSSPRSKELINSEDVYQGCDGQRFIPTTGPKHVGCVVMDCKYDDGAPSLIYVDSALSQAFRHPTKIPSYSHNRFRDVQMLLLTHDSTRETDRRYFNKIERTVSSDAGTHSSGLNKSAILYEAPLKETETNEPINFESIGETTGESATNATVTNTATTEPVTNATTTTGGRRPKRTRRTAKKKRRTSRKLTSSRRTRRIVVRRL